MTTETETSEAREKVLRVAGKLFSEKGYTAVTLKDIAEALGVKQAALYYHVPQGKEQLYVEVMNRMFQQHRKGIEQAISKAEPNLSARFKSVANWLLSQPPLDMSRMTRSDFPALEKKNVQQLSEIGHTALAEPLEKIINQAYQNGEIRLVDPQVMATMFLSMIDTIHDLHIYKGISKEVLGQDVIEVLLEGMRRR